MTAVAQPAVIKPSMEGDFVIDEAFVLDGGGVLHRPSLRYAMYGKLNAPRDNVTLVCHALSGSALVAEWWPQLFAPGGVLNLETDCVLGVNILGSCYGSTGPASVNPHAIDPGTGGPRSSDAQSGQTYGPGFPLVGIRDIVRSQQRLLDHLGIQRLRLVIGASIGGMQAIEWAILYPERVAQVVSIGVAPLGAMGLALNHLQRQAIQLDPAWNGGRYSPDAPPTRGLALARALAVCTYKSPLLFEERFGRTPDRCGDDPFSGHTPGGDPAGLSGGRFDVSGYLDYQGERFNARFDANSYLAITRTMDTFDPARGHESPGAAYGRIQASVVLVGISSDWLFPPEDIRALAADLSAAGVRCEYRELVSSHGHDAFLAQPEELWQLLSAAPKASV